MTGKRIAVIGAGPIGLEAALMAKRHGFTAVVLEQGRVAENVRSWGHARLFSPFGVNSSPIARDALSDLNLPGSEALLTGHEFFEQYLLPLSRLPEIASCIREEQRVVSIGKHGLWKRDAIGSNARLDQSFSILTINQHGHEEHLDADIVLDCSGTYGNHNWIGEGGIPAIGERALAERIQYRIPAINDITRAEYSGKTSLVIGSGYSAATTVVSLSDLVTDAPDTSIVWLTRSSAAESGPIPEIEHDSLTGRAVLARTANQLASGEQPGVQHLTGWVVERLEETSSGRINVELKDTGRPDTTSLKTLEVDNIIANVGYRPDRSLYEELQVHECYASQGPMKLAAALMGEASADCMNQSSAGADTLRNPEPNFFILGAKSYGRDSRFLLKIGLEQIRSFFELIRSDAA